ncbi:MAG TPA: VOC family protein [Candidatus Saccharimonadales bacterium]|nr:VOC family protein [Candidatus Saccharimonadales bacterium]
MKVIGIAWLGSRTRNFGALSSMFSKTMNMKLVHQEEDFNVFKTERGDLVEVFGMDREDAKFFPTAPVAGFLVEDIEKGTEELRANGIKCGEIYGDGKGNRWMHFIAPDGNMYELTERSRFKV